MENGVNPCIEPDYIAELAEECLIFWAHGESASGGDDVVGGVLVDQLA